MSVSLKVADILDLPVHVEECTRLGSDEFGAGRVLRLTRRSAAQRLPVVGLAVYVTAESSAEDEDLIGEVVVDVAQFVTDKERGIPPARGIGLVGGGIAGLRTPRPRVNLDEFCGPFYGICGAGEWNLARRTVLGEG